MAPSTNSLLLSLSDRFLLIGNHFIDALDNEFVLIGLTFAIFFLAKMVQRRTGWVLFNPILITIGAMIAFLKLTGIQYDTYHKAGSQIEFWLKPAIVALGVPLYQQLKVIRKQLIPILLSQTVGCVVGIVSAVRGIPTRSALIAFGEVGLTGEIRACTGVKRRVQEAARLGFTTAIIPAQGCEEAMGVDGITVLPISDLASALRAAIR